MGLASAVRLALELANRDTRTHVRRAILAHNARPSVECPCCGFSGRFESFGAHVRINANCPRCESKERHRLFALAINDGFVSFTDKDVVHFAPEPIVMDLVSAQRPASRITADIEDGRADRVLNIEALDLADASLDRIIIFHVLEHVNDAKALAEMYRVLRPGGQAVIMVPIIEGWAASYENPSITTEQQRHEHFGQWDHIRYYGADLRDRIAACGFSLSEYTADGLASVRYGLLRGEKVFLATKP